jgi:hypothetical protein
VSVAQEALSEHPEMVLPADDFRAQRINWNDEAGDIAELAAKLNLGLQSIPLASRTVLHSLTLRADGTNPAAALLLHSQGTLSTSTVRLPRAEPAATPPAAACVQGHSLNRDGQRGLRPTTAQSADKLTYTDCGPPCALRVQFAQFINSALLRH